MLIRRLAVAIGLLFTLLGMQAPEFAQQYRQRLAGRIDELTRVVADFDADATRHALSPEAAIEQLKANPDPLARDRGDAAQADKARLLRLQAGLAALKDPARGLRLWVFAESFDPEVASRALADFEPAAPVTVEAFVVGGIVGLWGWATTHLCAWPIRRRIARRREAAGRATLA